MSPPRKNIKQATIKDVAQGAGLSITAVSLVLNGKPNHIPEATRRRILDAADELNYVPNQVARAMVTKEMNAIGLLIPDISNVFFAALAKSVEQEAKRSDFWTLLCDLDNDLAKQVEYLRMLQRNNVKGVILASAQSRVHSEAVLSAIQDYGMTAVFADQKIDDERYDSISVDNRKGAVLAINYLLKLGHTRIGCILGPQGYDDSRERMEGVAAAGLEWGVQLDENLFADGDYTFESGVVAARRLIDRGATAIFAFNDMMAYGVWEAAKAVGKRIPEDLSVVGFDDLLFSKFMPEPLTTIYQPVAEIGKKTVQTLMCAMTDPTHIPRQVLLEPKLIVRSSAVEYREK